MPPLSMEEFIGKNSNDESSIQNTIDKGCNAWLDLLLLAQDQRLAGFDFGEQREFQYLGEFIGRGASAKVRYSSLKLPTGSHDEIGGSKNEACLHRGMKMNKN